MALGVKNPPANAGDLGLIPRLGRFLEEGSYSNILAWRIPRTEESLGLESIASQRVRHDWSKLSGMYELSWTLSAFILPILSWRPPTKKTQIPPQLHEFQHFPLPPTTECFSTFAIHPNPMIPGHVVTETQIGSDIKLQFLKCNIQTKIQPKLQTSVRGTVMESKMPGTKWPGFKSQLCKSQRVQAWECYPTVSILIQK